MKLPDINKRIRQLIDIHADGNVTKFSESCGLKRGQIINRLFLKDHRNNKYPLASIEIVIAIAEAYPEIDMNWLIMGKNKTKNNSVLTH